MLRDLNKGGNDGFASMTEIVVTSVIFVLATAGILSTVGMLRPQGRSSRKAAEAAHIGKGIIDQLRKEIDANTWSLPASGLLPGTTYTPADIGDYSISYEVTEPIPGVRFLNMFVTWPD